MLVIRTNNFHEDDLTPDQEMSRDEERRAIQEEERYYRYQPTFRNESRSEP